jgi:hypothetical protein
VSNAFSSARPGHHNHYFDNEPDAAYRDDENAKQDTEEPDRCDARRRPAPLRGYDDEGNYREKDADANRNQNWIPRRFFRGESREHT